MITYWYSSIILSLSAVVESHPDNAHPDLRLDRPFPGLVEYVDSLDLHIMTKQVKYQQFGLYCGESDNILITGVR